MKSFTREEKTEAKKKIPKPVLDFLLSPTLSDIYLGIQKKHGLDFRQLFLFCEIVNATLMNLEPQSALETNMHQAMHELSNEQARELVADINDRVFKEAQRRLRENILEPSVWSEAITAPEPTNEEKKGFAELEKIKNMEDGDPELEKLYREETLEEEIKRKKQLEEEGRAVKETSEREQRNVPAPQEIEKTLPKNLPEIGKGQMAAPRDVREVFEEPTDVHSSSGSISTQKLGTPSFTKPQEVTVGMKAVEIGTGEAQKSTTPTTKALDPYRELPD